MPTLSTTRNYADGEVLVRADLDAFLDDLEAFLNVTKINDDNIQDSGITGSTKLLNSSVTASKLAADSVTTLKILDSNVTTAKIADSAVTTAKIADANVTNAKMAANSVTTSNITDANVTTAKLADDSVTAAKLADSASTDSDRAVTTDHIRDSAITTAKINANAVTTAKLSVHYATATVSTGAWAQDTTKSLTSLAVNGRLTRISIYAGAVSTGALGAPGYASVVVQYSSDNSSWSDLNRVITLASNQNHQFDGSALNQTPTTMGTATAVHTPSSGTAYYRLIARSNPLTVDSALSVMIEEI